MKPNTKFDDLLPDDAITVEATPGMWESGLLPQEASFVFRSVEKRRREFTAGRNCARRALQLAGFDEQPILVREKRAPAFPEGVSGTITHTHGYCAAAVIRQGAILSIGIDAEINLPLDDNVIGRIIGPEEQVMLRGLPKKPLHNWGKLIFSIKESFYKAYFQVCQTDLDFLEAVVVIHPDACTFSIRVIKRDSHEYFRNACFNGRFHVDEGYVYSAIALGKDH